MAEGNNDNSMTKTVAVAWNCSLNSWGVAPVNGLLATKTSLEGVEASFCKALLQALLQRARRLATKLGRGRSECPLRLPGNMAPWGYLCIAQGHTYHIIEDKVQLKHTHLLTDKLMKSTSYVGVYHLNLLSTCETCPLIRPMLNKPRQWDLEIPCGGHKTQRRPWFLPHALQYMYVQHSSEVMHTIKILANGY